MRIHAGFRLGYHCNAPTEMLLMLNIHPWRRGDLLTDQVLSFDRPVEAWAYEDPGDPDAVSPHAAQHDIRDLPDSVLVYLLGSRYCETDKLSDFAWAQFGATEPGWLRVQAICDFVHDHIAFDYQKADCTRTAFGGFNDRTGVCRDFAHLAIALCRAMNIPARYCTGYLGDIGVPAEPAPMDFSAWFEAYLGGRWYTFDARHNHPRIGRILIATGRDATDVAISTSFGPSNLVRFEVVTDEIAVPEPRYGT